jgi:carboxyl-terminal processing protease
MVKMKLNNSNKIIILVFGILWVISSLIAYNNAISEDSDKYIDDIIAMEEGMQSSQYYSQNREASTESTAPTMPELIEKIVTIIQRLDAIYVDEVDYGQLMEDAINGMLKGLDPHTTYFSPDDFKNFTSSTKGEFGGLGIQIDKKGDYITVVSPIQGTPAYRMGIMAGDMIWKVDGEDITGITTDQSIKKMRGEVGSEVVITVIRPGVKDPLEFKIVRDIIKINSIPYSFKMDNNVGYIRMSQFNANTSEELSESLDNLEEEGIEGLIIDLRFNPGGLLSEAINTVNEFIGKGKRVVYTKGRIEYANEDYFTTKDIMRPDYPIVVLINEASASASEIFAGSMQDYDRGLVVGKTSFGKGSVQQLFPLRDGSGIKITTSHYYINSGRCIHKIINDKLLNGKKVTEEEKEDIDKFNHEHIYKTAKGRTVYGGGGVTPDIIVDADTLSRFELELRRKNFFFDYAVEYMLEHSDDVELDFRVNDKIYNDFVSFVIEKEKQAKADEKEDDASIAALSNPIDLTNPSPEDLAQAEDYIKLTLTSEIIEKKFGSQEGYKIRIEMDNQLQEAKSLFDKYDTLEEMFEHSNIQKS